VRLANRVPVDCDGRPCLVCSKRPRVPTNCVTLSPKPPGVHIAIRCRVLMVYPKFIPNSFWNYTEACELVGAKYPAAPLGLITVAAMLPRH